MGTDHHTPFVDGSTEYKAAHMNAPLGELDTVVTTVSGEVWERHSGEKHYDLAMFYAGSPAGGDEILRFPFPRTVDFEIDMNGSQAVCGTTAAAEAVFSVKKAGVQFATITFAAAGSYGIFSGDAQQFVGSGEVLSIDAPGSADATLADIGISLRGFRW